MLTRLHLLAWPLCVAWTVVHAACVGVALFVQVAPAMADTLSQALNTAPDGAVNPPWLVVLGFYPDRFVAGLCGGYVHMGRTAKRGTGLATWTRNVLAAGLTGNYLPLVVGLVIPAFHDLSDLQSKGAAFVLGYFGFSGITRLQRLIANSTSSPPDGDTSP